GLWRGLSHEDAARFAFLLATPVIAGAGLLKLPELAGPTGHGILGQVLAGSVVAGIGAYLSLKFLTSGPPSHRPRPERSGIRQLQSILLRWSIDSHSLRPASGYRLPLADR